MSIDDPRDIIFGPRDVPVDQEQIDKIVAHVTKLKEQPMPKMRAKLTIQSVTLNGYTEQVKFSAIYTGTKEDNSYSDATPNASADFTISNKDLHGQFKPGQKFYVDFTPTE